MRTRRARRPAGQRSPPPPPRRKFVSSWPVKVVLGEGERGGIAFSTPPEVTLDRWRKALPVLETMLGVADLDVSRSAPGEVVLWLPREVRGMTAFVPGPGELTHIASASTEAEARAAAVAAHGVFRWVLGRTSEGEILGERISRAPHALVAGGTGAGKSTWVTWLASTLVAAGADVLLADGKGSSDYDNVRSIWNVLGVLAVFVVGVLEIPSCCRRIGVDDLVPRSFDVAGLNALFFDICRHNRDG